MALVSASRAPELRTRSSIPRSLQSFQTRSLRDLQAKATPPPPFPPPESPQIRTTQATSTRSVRRVDPPPLDVSYGSEVVEMISVSLDQRSALSSSAQRRDAFEINRQSCYNQSNTSMRTDSTTRDSLMSAHERQPPIDPRKSRRYCTDFGLGRTELPAIPSLLPSTSTPPITDISSLASTPVTAYTDTEETESIASILDYPFPQPPSYEDQFRLRRMHSSPSIVGEDTNGYKHAMAKRYSAFVARAEMPYDNAPSLLATIHDEGPMSDGSVTIQAHTHMPSSTYVHPPNAPPGPQPNQHVEPPTSYQRTRSIPQKRFAPHVHDSVSTEARSFISLKPSLESLHRFHASMDKLKKWDPQRPAQNEPLPPLASRRDSNRPARRGPTVVSFQGPPPSLAAAGRQKPTHRAHLSTALTGLGLSSSAATKSSLGAPFQHRSTRSHPALRTSAQKESLVPKSFIDITPERPEPQVQQPGASGKKDRMKKLLHRASTIFNWNKAFGRKK